MRFFPTTKQEGTKGFTLLETLVAIAIFAIVATLALSALLVVQSSARRAQATRILVDNLGAVVDDIVRTAQQGKTYSISSDTHSLTITDTSGRVTTYSLVSEKIHKSVTGLGDADISNTRIKILDMTYTTLTGSGSATRVGIAIKAQIGQGTRYQDTINMYTSVTKREIAEQQ